MPPTRFVSILFTMDSLDDGVLDLVVKKLPMRDVARLSCVDTRFCKAAQRRVDALYAFMADRQDAVRAEIRRWREMEALIQKVGPCAAVEAMKADGIVITLFDMGPGRTPTTEPGRWEMCDIRARLPYTTAVFGNEFFVDTYHGTELSAIYDDDRDDPRDSAPNFPMGVEIEFLMLEAPTVGDDFIQCCARLPKQDALACTTGLGYWPDAFPTHEDVDASSSAASLWEGMTALRLAATVEHFVSTRNQDLDDESPSSIWFPAIHALMLPFFDFSRSRAHSGHVSARVDAHNLLRQLRSFREKHSFGYAHM